MSPAPQPRMHGLTHVHGGPDPALIAWEDVGGGGSGGGGGGIQFDVVNEGGFLDIRTDGINPSGSQGVLISAIVPGTPPWGIDLGTNRGIILSGNPISIGPNTLTVVPAGVSVNGSLYVSVQNAAGLFRILNPAGTPMLEVRGDGSFHIKAGATWVADL